MKLTLELLNVILENWGLIAGFVFAILYLLNKNLTEAQKKAFQVIFDFVGEIISDLSIKQQKQPSVKEIIPELYIKAERSENLKKVLDKINSTKGDDLYTTVSVIANNYDFIKKTGKSVYDLFRKFVFPFGKRFL